MLNRVLSFSMQHRRVFSADNRGPTLFRPHRPSVL
jgi:hypothetical protein